VPTRECGGTLAEYKYVRFVKVVRTMMRVTASALRQDIYRILDRVLETGEVVEIERKGKLLRIVPPPARRRVDLLPKRDAIVGDPMDLVHVDWSEEWSGVPELDDDISPEKR
jgi:antitoxin (DNA-binding transcriptional repressor) of toxin-antitoxin stability system